MKLGSVNGSVDLSAVLTRIEVDLAQAEVDRDEAIQRVNQLDDLRKTTQRLLDYATGSMTPGMPGQDGQQDVSGLSLADQVVEVFGGRRQLVLGMDQLIDRVQDANHEASAPSVKNAVYYAARMGRLKKAGRGQFALDE